MAEQPTNRPISALTELSVFSGTEKVPLAIGMASNASARLKALKEYFRDSSLLIFDEVDPSNVTVIDEVLNEETGATFAIVYLPSRKIFAERKQLGNSSTYTTLFNRWQDFLVADASGKKTVRTDKVFFNAADKEMYIYNGSLHNLFDTVRINVMTEDELENLENPIEGAIYATLE